MEININKVLEFIGSGYKVSDGRPFSGAKVKVITDKLNVYEATFCSLKGITSGFLFDRPAGLKYQEKVIAWKYINKKGK